MRANLLLLCLTLGLSALAFEGVLRVVFEPPPTWEDPQIRHQKSPRLDWVLPVDTNAFTIDAPVATNSLGLRDDEFPVERPPTETRILALGDSFTFALGVRFEDLYVQKLEVKLAARTPDRSVQVVNSGVAGYNTRQELIYLLSEGFALDPQLVTVGFYWNDLLNNDTPLPGPDVPLRPEEDAWRSGIEPHFLPAPIRDLLRQSLLIYLGVTTAKAIVHSLVGEERTIERVQRSLLEGDQEFLAPFWEQTAQRLLEIAEACKARGIPVLLIAFPMENQIRHDFPKLVWGERLREIWEPTGMPLLDLEPHYRESLARGENPYLPYDLHPSPLGMEIAAEAILKAIDDNGLLEAGRVADRTP